MTAPPALDAPFDALPDLATAVEAAVRWHFDPSTGSPFWLDLARSLPFDPLRDVTGPADLRRFPDVSDRLRTARVEDLVPKGFGDRVPLVFESGGTTGAPKRVVELGFWHRTARWIDRCLDAHGVAAAGNWLYLGPTGPHVAGYAFGVVAALRGGAFCTVDFDPRWVKRHPGQVDDYLDHVVGQATSLLRTQRISVLWATPPLLVAIADRPAVAELVASTVDTIVWSGVAAGPETLHLLDNEVFPDARVIGVYGNTVMGAAPQRPGPGCVFDPFAPHSVIEVFDPDTGVPVGYGERGRVRVHHLSADMFLPNVVERDLATRRPPAVPGGPDGVSDVVSARRTTGTFEEGVY
ncbi:AMP-binding protein [Saccharothrix obliqua]|uniref:AMP-binding protein n=1 Tax=Saccharothrix obliqua TaxID=2861747 RepID=UPI001C5F21BA|nr:AMP-binding protein [Saccharothrix obliqua]MBW4720314.1 phenazine antibiotic biosynthesis protein [Saccharothrix obliqua]